jgi:anaerobic dimethyl sulfoxide reductase subunit C (anchor subunit)
MNVREWALILFTILTQMSVGAFVVLGLVHTYALRKAGPEQADQLSDRALLAIGPVLVLGLIGSFGHLGNPLNAPRAISNLGTSWLSREIFFSVAFVVVGGVFAVMQWRKLSTFAVRNIVAWVAAVLGLIAVFSMSQVYMLRTVPVWNTWTTSLSFFATTFLLGALAMGAAFVANYAYVQRKQPGCVSEQCVLLRDTARGIALSAIGLLGVQFVVIPMYVAYLASSADTAMASQLITQQYALVFVLRLALVFVGAGVFGLFVYRNAMSAGREKVLGNLMYAAFAFVLIGEVLGRYLFYAMHTGFGL